ncbi:putative transporter YvbV [Paenibacillus cisolokensis]|uniref:Transporter YvbV n=1 Tax=Paenibacillus cisolokensis TaxID=1658519 RepID=A0ABQ4N4J9_9BACL|nr:DMT family transporter [Paenibacillus cisolokensis]GIQ63096.1 putative transporter YvbV [Paenibacillus cisolokensis]
MVKQHSRLYTAVLIAALVLIWGVSWPIYKIALNYTPPVLFAGMRTFLGGLMLALVALPRRKQIRLKENAKIYSISALFNVLLFFGLQTIGLTYLPGGLFSVLVYLQPVLVGLLAWLWLGEAMSLPKIAGLLLGFAGVAVISADGLGDNLSATGIVLALLTAVCWAFGAVYLKKDGGKADPLWLVSIQSMTGGAILTAIGSYAESWTSIVWNGYYLSGLLFGVILGVPTAWVIYFILVRSGEASKVATSTFLTPLISVIASTLFLHEPFHALLLVGIVMIVLSIYLVNRTGGRSVSADGLTGTPGRKAL